MVSLYPTVERLWNRLRYDRSFQLKWSVGFFFILSMLFSLGDGILYSFGWLAMGITGAMLTYRLLERYFFLALWLAGIYVGIYVGSLTAFHFASTSGNWFIMIFGYSILIIAFLACLFLILFIKERRDLIALEGEYIPIGLWSILIIVFYWSALFSIIGSIRWADGSLGNPGLYKTLYVVAELVVIPTFIFIASFPEDRFRAPYLDSLPDEGPFRNFIRNVTFKEFKEYIKNKKDSAETVCPQCGEVLFKESKKCPTCDAPRYFYWCNTSEDYFVRCPNCMNLTPIGNERCIHCSVKMSSKIRCSRCRDVHPVSGWI
jgi:hypothetical protein